jgi:hypothetical protein
MQNGLKNLQSGKKVKSSFRCITQIAQPYDADNAAACHRALRNTCHPFRPGAKFSQFKVMPWD